MGTGLQQLFSEDFENAAAFDQWAKSIRPQNRSCGNWLRSSTAQERPAGGSGSYASANATTCGPPVHETVLTSPAVDVGLNGVLSVTLEYDLYYNYASGGDTATVQIWDGSTWLVLWTSGTADVNTHHFWDVTAWAAGNAAFQVRFMVESADQWLSVDDVTIVADVEVVCETLTGPPPAPAGADGSTPLRGERLTPGGDSIAVSWDATSCTAVEYNLLYGDLSDVASTAITGGECAIGTGGSFDWNGVPSGDLFFLVVGADGNGTESSWGRDSLLGERNGITASAECATAAKDLSGTCP